MPVDDILIGDFVLFEFLFELTPLLQLANPELTTMYNRIVFIILDLNITLIYCSRELWNIYKLAIISSLFFIKFFRP
jgi:hypothetical protein